jgi:hypothetical protein
MLATHGRKNNGPELSLQANGTRQRRHLMLLSCRNANNINASSVYLRAQEIDTTLSFSLSFSLV